MDGTAGDTVPLHAGDKRFDIGAYQEELVDIVLVGGMHRNLGRWQAKDLISAIIDARQLEHIAKERAVGFRVRLADHGMRTDDHGKSSSPPSAHTGAL